MTIKYTKEHEWMLGPDENGHYAVGISKFASSELGDIVYVENEFGPGETVFADDVFGTIEAVKTVSDLFMPVDCTIVDVNEELEDNPELLNEDPLKNWIVKIDVRVTDQYDALMSEDEYLEQYS